MRIKKIVAALSCAVLLCACAQKTRDFRGADFGMSKSKVAKTEQGDYVFASDDLLFYTSTMDGYNVEVYYYFVEDKLTQAECKFPIEDLTINDDMERFLKVAETLTELYGAPVNADYRRFLTDDESEKGDADNLLIYRNLLEYYLEWDRGGFTASLLLNYKDAQVTLLYSAAAVEK